MESSKQSIIVNMIVPLLLHKLENLLHYDKIANSRSKLQVQNAKSELEMISRMQREAEKKGTDLVLEDPFMSEQLLNTLENAIDYYIAKTELQRFGSINIITLLISWTSRLDKFDLRRTLDLLISLTPFFFTEAERSGPTDSNSLHPQTTPQRNLDMGPDDSDFVGPKDKVNEFVEKLCDREMPNTIAVIGMAGSGKTILTKTVYNTTDVKRHFHGHAWVNFPENFDAREFLVNILTQLTWNWDWLDKNLSRQELKLKLQDFSKQKHCLIVVDDVRTLQDYRKLSHSCGFLFQCCRLILITCSQNVANAIRLRGTIIHLRSFTDEESWDLFSKKAQIAEDDLNHPELINIKENILRKCGCSPQAILILEGLLSTRDLREWPSVIEHAVQEHILDLGYQDLSSRLKFCFLYFGLFPRAFEVPVRRLFHLWLAEGLVIPLPEEDVAPEDLAEKYLEQLIRRNLIEVTKVRLDGSPKKCRMPTSIWDVFSPIAVDLGLFHIRNDTTHKSTDSLKSNIRRLVDYAGIGKHALFYPYIGFLRSYVSFNTGKRKLPTKEIGMFLDTLVTRRGFGLLIVLDLEKVYKPMLSETLGKLLLLKYLGLRWTFLDSLPMSVGNLSYLETLDVMHTNITTLPSSIWKAKNLRHLYLNENHFDMSIKKPNIWSEIILQTLSGLFIGSKSVVKNYLNKLVCLRKLKLTFYSKSVGAIAEWISELTSLQSLKIRSIDEYDRPSNLELQVLAKHHELLELYMLGQLVLPRNIDEQFFPQNLKVLTLSASKLEQDPMPMLGKLRQLKCLRLFRNSYIGNHMTCEGFPELRVLKLWMLEKLEGWTMMEGAMPHLVELEIRCCKSLKPEGLLLRKTLKEVILTNMASEFVAYVKGVLVTAFVKEIKLPFDALPE